MGILAQYNDKCECSKTQVE